MIYFPPGTYLVSNVIVMYYFSQLVGDALNPPTLKATSTFSGLYILDADVYIPDGLYVVILFPSALWFELKSLLVARNGIRIRTISIAKSGTLSLISLRFHLLGTRPAFIGRYLNHPTRSCPILLISTF